MRNILGMIRYDWTHHVSPFKKLGVRLMFAGLIMMCTLGYSLSFTSDLQHRGLLIALIALFFGIFLAGIGIIFSEE